MNKVTEETLSKVPQLTLLFWIIKLAATTLGETGGDAMSMSMNYGYLMSSVIVATIILIAVAIQIIAKNFHPFLYWTLLIAMTTVGITFVDYANHSLSIGYASSGLLLLMLLIASLYTWQRSLGTTFILSVKEPKAVMFYWLIIIFTQTLGTALGDWTTDTANLDYTGAALFFSMLLALVAAAHFWTQISKTTIFWAAFILTGSLSVVVADFLDKPISSGGLALDRYSASAALLVFIIMCIVLFNQKPTKGCCG